MPYPPKIHQKGSLDDAVELIDTAPLCCIFACDDPQWPAVFIPVIAKDRALQTLAGHMFKSNPLVALAEQQALSVRFVIQADQAYISPQAYAQKQRDGKVVPTWNFLAVQGHGHLRLLDAAATLEVLRAQTDHYEAQAGGDWAVSDAPAPYIEQLQTQIVGFEIEIDQWQLHSKVSENKNAADRARVIEQLEARGQAPLIRRWMQKRLS